MVYRRRCERDADTDREKNTLNLNKEQVRETRRLTHMAQRRPSNEGKLRQERTEEAREEEERKGRMRRARRRSGNNRWTRRNYEDRITKVDG